MKAQRLFPAIILVLALLGTLSDLTNVALAASSTIEVSQPTQVTSDSHYERGQAIVYDGTDYWLFYGRSESVMGNYQNDNPDTHDYRVYYKKATSVAGLAGASATLISGASVTKNANSYLGETGAAYFDGDVWTFATIDETTTANLYGWWTSDGGTTWTEVGPIVTPGLSTGSAHHDEIAFGGELFVVVRRGSDFYTTHSATPKTGSWSSEAAVGAGGGGLAHFFKDGSDLYLAVLKSPSPRQNQIHKYNSGTDSWSLVNSASSIGWDPTLFKVGSNYVFAQAPWVNEGGGRQYLIHWASTSLSNLLSGGSSKMVSAAKYDSNTWTEMWPIGFTDANGDSYLFFTSERDEPSQEGTGNIWYLRVDWDLGRDHYTYIQPAIDAATAGDTINVAAGMYTEQVTIYKSLTLQGAGAGSTIIEAPASLTGDASGSKNIVTITGAGVNAEFTDFTVRGPVSGLDIGIYVRDGAFANIHDNILSDLGISGGTVGILVGRAAHSTTGTATIDNNTISGYGKGGIVVDNTGSSAAITGNTITGGGPDPIVAQNGIQISRDATGTVTGNTVSDHVCTNSTAGCTDDPTTSPTADGASGILLYASGSGVDISANSLTSNQFGIWTVAAVDANIYDNSITGASGTGIAVWDADQWTTALGFTETATNGSITGNTLATHDYGLLVRDYTAGGAMPDVVVYNNSLSGNSQYGAWSNIALNASGNWWGINTSAGVAGEVGTNVDYTPWLDSGTDTSSDPGFQGDFSTLHVDDNSPQTGTTGRIQEGVDMVSSSTVYVAAGTYNESIVFDAGFDKDNLTISGDASNRPVVTGGVRFLQTATLDGLTFENLYIKGVASGGNGVFDMDNSGAVNDFVMDNCVIDGEDTSGRSGFLGQNLGQEFTITNTEFKDILGWAVMDSESGSGDGQSNLTLDTVTFANNNVHDSDGSVALRGDATDKTDVVNVYGNTWDNIGGNNTNPLDDEHWAAIEVNHAESANIYDNTVNDVILGRWGEGQAFQFWDVNTLDMHGNSLTNNAQGIFVFGGSAGGPYGGPYAVPGGSIYCNIIEDNNEYGIKVETTATGGPLNAERNWWGDASGPTHSDNPDGSGDAIFGPVDYYPWETSTPPCTGPCIALEKTGPDTAYVGETITYHFKVINCGTTPLIGGAHVYDPLFGGGSIWDGDMYPWPDESSVATFTRDYTVQASDFPTLTNTALAVGHPPGMDTVYDEDTWEVSVSWPSCASTVYVDDDYCDGCGNDGHYWGYNAFATVQDGIDGVCDGGTVYVAAGTYNESVTINKDNLTVLGASGSRPAITGGLKLDTDLTGLTFKNFRVTGTVPGQNSVVRMYGAITDLTIDNCVFDGENTSGRHGFSGGQLEGDVTVINSEFKNILGWALFESKSGSGGDGSAMGTVTFANNHVHDSNGSVVFRGLSTDRTDVVNAYGNTWENIGGNGDETGQHWAALEVNRAVEVNVYDNTVKDVSLGEWGEGQAFQFWDIDTLNVYGNNITNNAQGIFIYGGAGAFAVPGGSIHCNVIEGNDEYGIEVDDTATGGPLDAEKNWWGDASGPSGEGSGTGDAVHGNVDYDPWSEFTPPCVPHPCVKIEKRGPETAHVGETITYHFKVTNCGNMPLLGGCQVVDPLLGGEIWHEDMEPYQVAEFDHDYKVKASDPDLLVNTARAIGRPPDMGEVSDEDSCTVQIIRAKNLTLTPDSKTVTAGQKVTYQVTAEDANGNPWGVTGYAEYSIPADAGGSWADNEYTSQKADTWTVTAEYDGQTATASLTVEPNVPAQLVLSAEPTTLPADGESTAAITATVSDAWNNLVADDTMVTFSTTAGTLNPDTALTEDGLATATLRSDVIGGVAVVTVTVGEVQEIIEVGFEVTASGNRIYLPVIFRE